MPADVRIEGVVEIDGDVTIRAAPGSLVRPTAEIDVPTQHADLIVGALRKAGFGIEDTGVTVDTDEGEETLTTVLLDLESLERASPPAGERRVLRVRGDLLVERGARVRFHLEADGVVRLEPEAIVEGEVASGQEIHLGAGTRWESIRCSGDVFLADAMGDLAQRIRARRIVMGP